MDKRQSELPLRQQITSAEVPEEAVDFRYRYFLDLFRKDVAEL